MIKIKSIISLAIVTTALSGCISEDPSLEGVSLAGGNAIAHNTALQIVDPWPEGVQDTSLTVPANGGNYNSPAVGGDSGDASAPAAAETQPAND